MRVEEARRSRGVVAAGHPEVAEAGAELLARGGNAVDAAVGAFFAAFHAEPMLSSPAGAGFLVAQIDGEAAAWDFFAAAPGLGASRERPWQPADERAFYAVEVDFGSARQSFHIGAGSVAVPGALAGLCCAQREAGRLPLATLLEPAIRISEGGATLSRMGHGVLRLLEPIVRATPEQARLLTRPDGSLLCAGDTFANPELAAFFRELAQVGSEALLYRGRFADAMLELIAAHGGGLDRADLEAYRVVRRAPLTVPLCDGEHSLVLTPPPSSGGMLVAYGLALLESQRPLPVPGSTAEVLLLRAVMAETLRARAELIGAATPSDAHMARLLDGASLEAGRARVRALLELGASALPELAPVADNAVGNTTHVSAIDGDGNACAITLSNGECSGLVVPGYGVTLNNFLGEEDLNPCGWHRFAPGARLGSTMTPAILRSRDGAIAALGSGGSNRIRTALLQVIARLTAQGQSLAEAVGADRMHYEHGLLYAEATGLLREPLDVLQRQGLRTSRFDVQTMFFGGVHVARQRADGSHEGIGDARRCGASRRVD